MAKHGTFQVLQNNFFWKLDTPPPPRNANYVGPCALRTSPQSLPHYVTFEKTRDPASTKTTKPMPCKRPSHANHWEDDIPKWCKEIGILMAEVNNWVKDRHDETSGYTLNADGRSKVSKPVYCNSLPGM